MATSFTFNFNTLQWRELFSLSYCKCFNSTTLLHTSHFSNHFSNFSSHKHSNFSSFCSVKPHLTVKSPVNRRISAVFCSLNCGFSDGGVEFRNNCENLKGNIGERVKNGGKSRKFGGRINFESRNDMGCSVLSGNFEIVKENFGKNVVDDGKRRKNGERVNFGRRNEMGDGISLSNEKEKLRKEVVGDEKRRNNGVRVDFGRRNETGSDNCSSSEIVKEEIYGKKDERINFGRGNEMGNGISSSSDKWRRRENNGDSGWSRENGDEILGKIGGNVDFGGRNEMSDGVTLSKSSGGKGMRRMEIILSSVEKVNENRGQKGSRVFPERRKGDKSRSSVVDRKVYGQVIKDGKYNDDRDDTKVKRKERLSKKNKVDSPMFQLKIGLDTCSKIGDVMGAIALYDSAVKQGVKMGQHHYTVLLYLCSSAAMGVIRPAKSGSRSRALDMVASHDQPNDSEEEEEDDYTDYLDDEGLGAEGQMEKFEMDEIRVSDEVKKYALEKGFEVYERMCLNKVPMNEAALTSVARMAMAMGDGDMAFDMVKEMKSMGISPKLRSYGPALSVFSIKGEVDKAFAVEKHMLENGVHPEEPELEALLRVSIECEKADKVYYVLHKLRTVVRSVSPSTAELIEKWFRSRQASRVGKRKWDANSLARIMENVGGGWHGHGWLGSGKWTISRTSIGADGFCKCCGEKLALIDLDPEETAKFAASVASIALKKDRNSSFQKFQRWLDYYGPFEAVVDAANVGLYNQRKLKPSKVNAVVNGIRQLLPSKKWPLIILHNKRVTGSDMAQPVNRALIDRWKNADALYSTPTGSNDDWYWLYAAIKFKCLLVTNDEMRDHTFQLLGNDFFPKWKERHQVRFKFSEIGPVFDMPPPCSVVIQESDRGVWHIPIASKRQSEGDRTWLCISRSKVLVTQPDFDVGGDLVEDNPGD